MSIIIALATLPVFFILYYVYRKDDNKEPISKLVLALFVGCCSTIPASLQESVLTIFAPSSDAMPILAGLYEGFVVAAFSEELWKLMLLSIIIWRAKEFDEYFDGIVYAVFVSMGFAGIENLLYVFSAGTFVGSVSTATVRGIISVPGHFLFAVAMGYYFSLAKFDPQNRLFHLFKALLYPIILHGTFDAILMVSTNLSVDENIAWIVGCMEVVVFIIFDIYLWRKGMSRIRQMQELSRQQDFDRRAPFQNFHWKV